MSSKPGSPRLGRGLAALLGDSFPNVAETADVHRLPLDLLEPGPFQPRRAIRPEAMAELVDSIRRQGVLQPILVRPHPGQAGRYQIIAGERRWRAAQTAGLHDIPVLVRELTDSDAMAAALVENLQRHDLNAVEEAEGYRRLVEEFGLTQEKLGEAVGKSRSHIANSLRLLNLPPPVRGALENGDLSAGHARALLSHPDPVAAMRVVLGKGLNVRQTEALVQKGAAGDERPPAEHTAVQNPETLALERDLTERLGLRVKIAFDGKGGTVRIRYRNLDQLDGLVSLLTRA